MPEIITRLDPAAVTYGRRVGISAAALGEPLITWQARAAALINAVDPDRPDAWRYPLVVITVPRQSGKSTLLRAVHTDRLIKPLPTGRPTKPTTLWTTAQKGKDARRRFNDLADRVAASPLASIVHRRRSIGSESLTLGNVALSPFAPTADALHGETTPFVSIDEAWAFEEDRAAALLAAVTPTMQNIAGSQLIIISTAGNHKSRWLWSLVKAGRASVSDPAARMAYIEYSADPRYADDGPAGLDPLDPAALSFHPAIGQIPDVTAEAIAALYPSAGGLDNIRRGFLNLWPADMDAAGVVRDLDHYDAALVEIPPPPAGSTVFAFDVARDRSGAAIYAATPTAAGAHIELVESAPGLAWLDTALAALDPLWHDPAGYTGAAAARLDHQPRPVASADLAAASAQFLADLADGQLTISAPPDLRQQFETAATRSAGGAGFMFDPDKSPGPIDHLRAAALALHVATRHNGMPTISY